MTAASGQSSERTSIYFCVPGWLALTILLHCCAPLISSAQGPHSPDELKALSMEELMNLTVSLASRTPQKLSESASAIQVLTGSDIRRSGATNLPEALRLLTNLQVAQVNAHAWVVSARGYNTLYANKLLVMIDGRTVYTPLFGGVIWSIQNLLLEDIDRIEVVSGPGGSLWGANAVNGVINIITKRTSQTQGVYASVANGTYIHNQYEARIGGKLGPRTNYRVYGQHFERKGTPLLPGERHDDAWRSGQGGFRIDWNEEGRDQFTLQGDFYSGLRKTPGEHSGFNGQNLLGRWVHTKDDHRETGVQIYYDSYLFEDKPGTASDRMHTLDVDFQSRFPAGRAHRFVWGLGYRYVKDISRFATEFVAILPSEKRLDLIQGFVQDEIALREKLGLTLGTKILHNVYTGIEIQPTVRLAWLPSSSSTLWGAISRAVRTPSRYDVDYYLPAFEVPPPGTSIAGGPDFISEKKLAFEAGYRLTPNDRSTFSLAGFYNRYMDIYSVEATPGTQTYHIMNGSEGPSWGLEFSGTYQLCPTWKLRGGYTWFDKNLRAKSGVAFNPDYLGNDANHIALLQSILDLPGNFHLDLVARYIDRIPATIYSPEAPAYTMVDLRLAWNPGPVELSLTGLNLTDKEHIEFGPVPIPRHLLFRMAARL